MLPFLFSYRPFPKLCASSIPKWIILEEKQDAIAADLTGDGFIFDMFVYELANHEYCITYDLEDTLDALGLTAEQINADKRLTHGLNKAIKHYLKNYKNL